MREKYELHGAHWACVSQYKNTLLNITYPTVCVCLCIYNENSHWRNSISALLVISSILTAQTHTYIEYTGCVCVCKNEWDKKWRVIERNSARPAVFSGVKSTTRFIFNFKMIYPTFLEDTYGANHGTIHLILLGMRKINTNFSHWA